MGKDEFVRYQVFGRKSSADNFVAALRASGTTGDFTDDIQVIDKLVRIPRKQVADMDHDEIIHVFIVRWVSSVYCDFMSSVWYNPDCTDSDC